MTTPRAMNHANIHKWVQSSSSNSLLQCFWQRQDGSKYRPAQSTHCHQSEVCITILRVKAVIIVGGCSHELQHNNISVNSATAIDK